MRTRRLQLGLVFTAALLLARCGEIGGVHLGPLQLEVHYHDSTDGRPLEALILHKSVDDYDEADNLLTAPSSGATPRGSPTCPEGIGTSPSSASSAPCRTAPGWPSPPPSP